MYSRLGGVVDKIHRAVCFRQSNWLKDYIDLNTQRRMEAQDEFSKDFFKVRKSGVILCKTIYFCKRELFLHIERKSLNKPISAVDKCLFWQDA